MEQHIHGLTNIFNPLPGMTMMGNGMPEMSGPYTHYASTHPYPPTGSYQAAAAAAAASYGGAAGAQTQNQNLLYSTPHHHAAMLPPNAALMNEFCNTQPHYGHNIGSAVSSSMHITNSAHDGSDFNMAFGVGIGGMGGANSNSLNILGNNANIPAPTAYKMEHDMLGYTVSY